jgi:hypothetical protein
MPAVDCHVGARIFPRTGRNILPVPCSRNGAMKSLAIRPFIGTCLLLLIPLVMSVIDRNASAGDGWHWDFFDFCVMGALLFGAGLCYEFFARKLGTRKRRLALGVAILSAVLAIWVELAVGGISQLAHFIAGAIS